MNVLLSKRSLFVPVGFGLALCVELDNTAKLQYTHLLGKFLRRDTLQHTATHCNTLQHTATHCNTLQHTATQYTPYLLGKFLRRDSNSCQRPAFSK